MTAGGLPGLYGGYNYQSPTMRALGAITPESYDYRDQSKLMSKLVGDVSFMGGMMRKMQKGIDDANQNFIQQLQSMLNDFMVLLAGGGDTGLNFGDLKYVLQAIGALFGFEDGALPINLFDAAWHFFSNYIMPVDNFEEAINVFVDTYISTMLGFLDEIPIVGQAAQQVAVIISDIRDLLTPIAEAVQALFDAMNIDLTDIDGIGDFFGIMKPIWDALSTALDGINLPDFSATFHQLALLEAPYIQQLAQVITVIANIITALTSGTLGFADLADVGFDPATIITNLVVTMLENGVMSTGFFDDLGIDVHGLLDFQGLFDFFSQLPIGNLGNQAQNLLFNPNFMTSDALDGEGIWNFDNTITHLGSNSVWVTGAGIVRELESNRIRVSLDQSVDFSVYAKWESLAGSGSPIQLMVRKFHLEADDLWVEVGSPETVASIPYSANGGFTQLVGSYDIDDPEVDAVTLLFIVTETATAGTVRFAKAFAGKSQLLPIPWVKDLPFNLSNLQEFSDTIISTIFSAFGGGDITGLDPFDALTSVLQAIPSLFVTGWGGPGNAADTWQATWDQIIGGAVGALGTGSSLADLFNIFYDISSKAAQGPMALNSFGGLNTSRATWRGLLPSSDATMNFSSLLFNKTPGTSTPAMPTVNVPAGTEYINWEVVQQDTDKQAIQWHGKLNSGVTDLRYRIWKMSPTTGLVSCLHTSSNSVGTASAVAGVNTYTAPSILNWKQGDIFGVGLHPIGGSLDILGDDTWHTYNHTTVFPRRSASLHSSRGTSTATPADISGVSMESLYTSKYAHLEYALNTGNPPAPHAPITLSTSGTGAGTVPVPDWANEVQLIVVPGGGKGAGGSSTLGINGDGGNAGTIGTLTLTRGTHFTTGAIVDFNAGVGSTGSGGGLSSAGIGANTVSRAGGTDGSGWVTGSAAYGASPGTVTVDSIPYNGGAQQTSLGSAGNSPGGAGSGGGYLQGGGNGAKGIVWIRFKQ